MMIRWWEHSQKGVTDGQTDGQTDRRTENTIHRAAWSQLKTLFSYTPNTQFNDAETHHLLKQSSLYQTICEEKIAMVLFSRLHLSLLETCVL